MLYTVTFPFSFYLIDVGVSIYFNIGTILFLVAEILLLKMGDSGRVTFMRIISLKILMLTSSEIVIILVSI